MFTMEGELFLFSMFKKEIIMKKLFFIFVTIILSISLFLWVRQIYNPRTAIPTTIIVGTAADFPPISFKSGDKIIGFDIDVVTEAVKRLKKPMRLEDIPFELLLPQLQTGTIHIVAAGLTITHAREERVFFSKPHLSAEHFAVITPKEKGIVKNIDDLKNKIILVNSGYTSETYMSKLQNISLLRAPTIEIAMRMLKAGKADSFVTGLNTVEEIFNLYGRQHFSLFIIEDTDENSGLAISKQYPVLAKAIYKIIEDMKLDGTIKKLKKKWHIQ